jgi:hypothetical protein
VRKAIGGEKGRAVDAAIPDAIHSSATIMGLERLQHTMKILHVVAVMPKTRLMRLGKHSSEKARHSAGCVNGGENP